MYFILQYKPFQENLDVYLGLEQYLLSSSISSTPIPHTSLPAHKLATISADECNRLHCVVRDLSSLVQALGRLADRFTGENFLENYSDALGLIERFVLFVHEMEKLPLLLK